MSGKAFVDTNILLYAHDLADSAKNAIAVDLLTQLWNDNIGVTSTQVLQEFAVNLQRRITLSLTPQEVRARIVLYLDWEVVVIGKGAVLRGLDAKERYKISFWDAMIVQAAESAGCEVLYSEDLSHGQEYGGVLVVNPFLS
ncbi:MAG TPA: PIN domain-containing protein [Candidatus Acidoferrum sp.]|nr:PIN domain-containing protein [Candidatus Acidoferrum sp.]